MSDSAQPIEYLDLVDKLGRKTGEKKKRKLVHVDGDWHASAHLWLINENNEVLLQKRSAQKKLFPEMWIAPVSGHIDAGDEPVSAVVREAEEELNLRITEDDIFLLAVIRGQFVDEAAGMIEREYINVFVTHKNFEIDLNFQNEEVAGFKWLDFAEFNSLTEGKDNSLVPVWEEYNVVVSYIKHNRLNDLINR